ncbi:MAG: methyltransferase domain-containing protein [Gammaproteobacteria bacterium]|nr:MAG: methyltransferase domain-containing protein [Gammaproteobacteria bacterium]
MSDTSRHDAWNAGDSYDIYMGRWSRQIATKFLDWLDLPKLLRWLEVGCGTGALTESILSQCEPSSLLGIEQSQAFVATARANVVDDRVEFQVGDAQRLGLPDHSVDLVVSALVLNFIPDKEKALREMRRVCRPGGTVAFYVWDYPGGGLELLSTFWQAAISLNPEAADLAEDKRFPYCTREGLKNLASAAGLLEIESTPLEAPAVFKSFDDFWIPFTLGAGPAPGFCVNLEPEAREQLRDTLLRRLPILDDGSIPMKIRAWGIRAATPQKSY